MTGKRTWSDRLKLASNAVHVFALLTAIIGSAIQDGVNTTSVTAAAIALLSVVLALQVRVPFPTSYRRDMVTVIGSLLGYCIAITLTGGIESTYTLLPVASVFLASMGDGIRPALVTASFAIVGVGVASVVTDSFTFSAKIIQMAAIYVLTAIAFSEAQRAITAQAAITDEARLASDLARSRRATLEATHEILGDLVAVVTSPGINAVTAAQDAVRDIAIIFPSTAAQIVDETGTVLARRGPRQSSPPDVRVRSDEEGSGVATVDVWCEGPPPNEDQITLIQTALVPVGLAIQNNEMLLGVAGLAVQRERVRLARELHDDIAPRVASVGLTLDMLLLTDLLDGEHARNIAAARDHIGVLVERIRDRVQDLRADRSRSLTEFTHGLVAEVDTDGPTIVVSLEERTPPRNAIAAEIEAILKESFRNALTHAEATIIEVGGRINEGGGTLTVRDNGVGFDPATVADARFGIVGMRERAHLINADVALESTVGGGTLVTISWRDDP